MFDPRSVKAEMARNGVTLKELSQRTGLGVSSIHKMLAPGGNPRVKSLTLIAEALEVPVAIFFGPRLHHSTNHTPAA